MYLRITKVKRSNGHIDENLQLVEADWNQGRPRHRVVCHLGRKEPISLAGGTVKVKDEITIDFEIAIAEP